jgi:hypothetical protein
MRVFKLYTIYSLGESMKIMTGWNPHPSPGRFLNINNHLRWNRGGSRTGSRGLFPDMGRDIITGMKNQIQFLFGSGRGRPGEPLSFLSPEGKRPGLWEVQGPYFGNSIFDFALIWASIVS